LRLEWLRGAEGMLFELRRREFPDRASKLFEFEECGFDSSVVKTDTVPLFKDLRFIAGKLSE